MSEELAIFKNYMIVILSLLISFGDVKEIFQILALAGSLIFTIVQTVLAIKKHKRKD